MSIFAVLGATGRMGGATARALLKEGATVRAVTRNRHAPAAAALADVGAEIVACPRRIMNYRILILLLVLVSVSGCRRSPVEAADPLRVVLTTDKILYQPDDRIYVQIENHTSNPILVRDCIVIEQHHEQQWASVGHLRECLGTFQSVHVGNRYGRGTSLGDAFPAGVYRVANMVLLQEDWKQQERAVSEAFTIAP